MRVPHGRPPYAPEGGGRRPVVGPVNLGLGRAVPRPPRPAEQNRATGRFPAGGDKDAAQALTARRLGATDQFLAPDGNRIAVDAIDTAGVGDAFPGTLAAHLGGGLAVRPAAQRSA
ncbi:hypothetical protein [Streptomyces sp. 5-6(2022)]|uniref:hypothetical protein n=1 Tax=Streptomyces sp. 5-6(2022) TaxID=2936510 RepID=UPI0023B8F62D|nr:hypothetical protein [Streptomyces sp. 5-6(2022)]